MAKIKAAVYTRYSSNNQTEASNAAQYRACKKYADEHDIEIIKIYADEAKTGTNDNRPEFQRMLSDSANGEFSVLLIHKTDRFSRNKANSICAKAQLETNGVSVISVVEQFGDGPEGIIMESLMEGWAQYYSMNLSREVKKGQYESALKQLFLGGVPPLGYKVKNQKYILDDFNARAVKLIFDMYCSRYSHKKIADELNRRGYKTQRGKRFTKNAIRNIIMNERYTGVYIYNQRQSKGKYSGKRNNSAQKDASEIIRHEGAIPQIISKEQFQKAQDILRKHEHLRGGKNHRYLLTGKVNCGCGGLMWGNTRKSGRNKIQHSYYRCDKCGHEINIKYLDEFTINSIKANIVYSYDKSLPKITKEFNDYVKKNKESLNGEIHSLKVKIDGYKKKVENLLDKLSDTDENNASTQAVLNKISELQKTIENLEANKSDLERKMNVTYATSEINKAFKNLMPYIIENDTIAVRNFIDENIREIKVDRKNNTVEVITR